MKIKLICPQCFKDSFAKIDVAMIAPKNERDYLLPTEITSSGIFEACCQAGHKILCSLSNPNYEIIFDMGYSAYKDGYYREACLDFAASYERFHQYCIYAMLCQESGGAMDDLDNMWKLISRQSERQYGAFVVLYTNVTGMAPIELSQKWKTFRNDITHKGIIPTSEKTFEYAKAIGEYTTQIYGCLTPKIGMWKGIYPKLQELVKKGQSAGSITLPTILSSLCRGESFEEATKSFDKMYDLTYSR